ncbi:amidophosphoribosyltransferase [Desulfosporosinus acidiphilus SJ4]|uniref:Amidophosphoribosyltransferase n=1 Tax=Desulfosporosinus acidiphilus (strain DSM 22704 / JCM 16185 / SJ4) TaxID=646529 RepID=I4D6K6_DESAJ|nr:amidophosphoribosyltransferase [Desulfosporosinus acidiphilus]AFM41430.1 amidophosphoribosyltransferase [Desulfosporosinus acidiphilus SJ4]
MNCEHDKPKEECGVFGILGSEDNAARLAFSGLRALQHRGQESCGITISNKISMKTYKALGLVTSVFNDGILDSLHGSSAIGHVRYSTTGSNHIKNAQPLTLSTQFGEIALAHNGNIMNAQELRLSLTRAGHRFESTADSEVILHLINQQASSLENAISNALNKLYGAYSLVVMTNNALIGIRDPFGLRPLCLGRLGKAYCLASESFALQSINATFIRDIAPGEMIIINETGIQSHQVVNTSKTCCCAFEYIYFAHPASTIDSINVEKSRFWMGQELAREYPIDADVVIPVPRSGRHAALGYASARRLPLEEALLKTTQYDRSFIQPAQPLRELVVTKTIKVQPEVIRSKRVILIDDSLVRGTTAVKLVKLIREAGAREVHLLIASPRVQFPCYYGIDIAEKAELIAAQMSVDKIREYLNADTLYYLSQAGLLRSVFSQDVCLACFNKRYPLKPRIPY